MYPCATNPCPSYAYATQLHPVSAALCSPNAANASSWERLLPSHMLASLCPIATLPTPLTSCRRWLRSAASASASSSSSRCPQSATKRSARRSTCVPALTRQVREPVPRPANVALLLGDVAHAPCNSSLPPCFLSSSCPSFARSACFDLPSCLTTLLYHD